MITSPILFAVAVFFALVTIAPERKGFIGWLSTMTGALIAAVLIAFSFSTSFKGLP
jgi:hypothetical protein